MGEIDQNVFTAYICMYVNLVSLRRSLILHMQVAAAGGGAEAKLAGVAEANSETVAAYWQAALPSSPIPLAVLDLFTPNGLSVLTHTLVV